MSNAVDLLPANLQSTLHQVIERANTAGGGILVILLSTAEGVPLGRIYADRLTPLNEDVLSSIESTWAPASKQFPLLGLGKEARIATAIYDHGRSTIKKKWHSCRSLIFQPFFLVIVQQEPSFMFIKRPWYVYTAAFLLVATSLSFFFFFSCTLLSLAILPGRDDSC